MTEHAILAPRILARNSILRDHAIIMDGAEIKAVCSVCDASDISERTVLRSGMLVPGFVDVQVNGGGGILFNDDPSLETIEKIGDAHRRFGTTGFLPTLITDDLEKTEAAVLAVDRAIRRGVPGVMGVHLEGPFLNPAKRGVHDASKIRALLPEFVDMLTSLKGGKTVITLAPEQVPRDIIVALVRAGVIVSAGHTNATHEQLADALSAGVTGFTHLYNAMSPLESRAPGAVGAALSEQETFCGLIADGHHVHPAALLVAIRAKGVDRCMLVTDAMPCVGSDLSEFQLGNERIFVSHGRCTNAGGKLAGSALDMASAFGYAIETLDLAVQDASAMASSSPAKFLGLGAMYGRIAPGFRADLVHLTDDLAVERVWVGGQLLVEG